MQQLVRVVAVLSALLVVVPAVGAGAHEDPGAIEEELRDTRSDLEDARSGLSEIRGQVGDAEEQLAAADRELVSLTEELHAREAELAAARAELAAAQDRTAEATVQLRAVTQRLEESRAELEERQELFDDRIADTYKHGGSLTYAQAVLGADSPGDLVRQMYYVRSVMRSDQTALTGLEATADRIARARERADSLRDRVASEEERAASAAQRVEAAARAQQQMTEMVEQERAARARLVSELEADRQAYDNLVASLETESQRLEEELAEARAWRPTAPSGELLWPTNGRKTSNFGYRTHPIFGTSRMHAGIDISGGIGQPIVAAADGRVVHAGWRGGYGLAVVVDHGGGMATLYAHQSALSVSSGQVVGAGQKVGEVGSTGYSTGPHLHFEVRIDGVPKDPMQWFS